MDVKEIIAGNQIVISGNKISLDDIKQRDDADGMLISAPAGSRSRVLTLRTSTPATVSGSTNCG